MELAIAILFFIYSMLLTVAVICVAHSRNVYIRKYNEAFHDKEVYKKEVLNLNGALIGLKNVLATEQHYSSVERKPVVTVKGHAPDLPTSEFRTLYDVEIKAAREKILEKLQFASPEQEKFFTQGEFKPLHDQLLVDAHEALKNDLSHVSNKVEFICNAIGIVSTMPIGSGKYSVMKTLQECEPDAFAKACDYLKENNKDAAILSEIKAFKVNDEIRASKRNEN